MSSATAPSLPSTGAAARDPVADPGAAGRLRCWHCRETMRADECVDGEVAGQRRAFCCIGCRAAACWIEQAGLVDYYRLRDKVPVQQ